MALGKQAKTLTEAQEKAVLGFLADGRQAQRNRVMFLLSVDAGLRSKEIAAVTWEMVTDATGALTDEIRLEDTASKGKSGGVVFISKRLGAELAAFADTQTEMTGTIIKSERRGSMSLRASPTGSLPSTSVLAMKVAHHIAADAPPSPDGAERLAASADLCGMFSRLPGTPRLQMTQRYIEVSEDAMKKVVG